MEDDIKNAIETLKNGGVILYPTDTVWGIGCDATNDKAIEKIFKIKRRTDDKKFIILVDSFEKLKLYVKEVPAITRELINSVEEPLTIVYDNAMNLPQNAIEQDGSVAIRIVENEFCKKMISAFGKPIVSTSANVSGEKTPIVFNKISEEIISAVDYVVKAEHDKINYMRSSTIIQLTTDNEFRILRS